jgi:hypothetical protein
MQIMNLQGYFQKISWEQELMEDIIGLCEYMDYSYKLEHLRIAREEILKFRTEHYHDFPLPNLFNELKRMQSHAKDLTAYITNMKDNDNPTAVAYLRINKQQLTFLERDIPAIQNAIAKLEEKERLVSIAYRLHSATSVVSSAYNAP